MTVNGIARKTRKWMVSNGGVSSQCHERMSCDYQNTARLNEIRKSICHTTQMREVEMTDERLNGHGMVKAHGQTHPQLVTWCDPEQAHIQGLHVSCHQAGCLIHLHRRNNIQFKTYEDQELGENWFHDHNIQTFRFSECGIDERCHRWWSAHVKADHWHQHMDGVRGLPHWCGGRPVMKTWRLIQQLSTEADIHLWQCIHPSSPRGGELL